MNLLLLKGFNNYFNRIVKKYTTLEDYRTNSTEYKELTDINFNPSDGVNTTLVIGGPFSCDSDYDYLVAGDCESRWFIIDESRTRQGQYQITLRRDVLADHLDDIINAPCYIEKGSINDVNNPLLYNSEGNRFNQIKQSETLLKDNTQTAWIVGYTSKSLQGETYTCTLENSGYIDANELPFFDALNIDSHQATKSAITSLKSEVYWVTSFTNRAWPTQEEPYHTYVRTSFKNGGFTNTRPINMQNRYWRELRAQLMEATFSVPLSDMNSTINNLYGNSMSTTTADALVNIALFDSCDIENYLSYEGRIVRFNSKFYKLHFTLGASDKRDVGYIRTANEQVNNFMATLVDHVSSEYSVYINEDTRNKIGVYAEYQDLYISAEETTEGVYSVEFSANRTRNEGDIFDVFMIPFSPLQFGDRFISGTINPDVMMAMATSIAKSMGANLYDLQVLPYSPINKKLYSHGTILNPDNDYFFNNLTLGEDYEYITTTVETVTKRVGFVFFPKNNSFTSYIPLEQKIDREKEYVFPDNPDLYWYVNSIELDAKIENECTSYRLCSPNYNGIYEYRLSKFINGNSGFNIYATYKPFNPYIKMNPIFTGLYGQDYADSTGLICGGDFSLGIINDEWVNYQIQNKNYQALFDRQIQSMDLNQDIARQEANLSAIAGTFQGAAAGAQTGAMLGGGYGAVAGAIIGGGISAIGGALDLNNLNKRLADARGLALDQHKYNLSNIQALPQSISKSSPLTKNNKIWPVLEKISCTDEEKQIFKKQLQYDGESVNAIGTIADYNTSSDFDTVFVKGSLIRLDSIIDNAHVVNEIYAEIKQGNYWRNI